MPEDWRGRAGERFRKTADAISDFLKGAGINPRDLPKNAVSLAYDKLEGVAQKEKAAALRDFSEAEERKIDAKLKERSLESKVRREEAETRLTEIKVLQAEVELFQRLKELGVALRRDENGNYTVLPVPQGFDLSLLANRKMADAEDKSRSEEGSKRSVSRDQQTMDSGTEKDGSSTSVRSAGSVDG